MPAEASGADPAIAAHVAACDACRTTVDDLRSLRAALADLPDVAPPRPLRLVPPVIEPAARTGWASLLRRLTAPAMALAVILIVVGAVGTAVPLGGTTTSAGALDEMIGGAGQQPAAAGSAAPSSRDAYGPQVPSVAPTVMPQPVSRRGRRQGPGRRPGRRRARAAAGRSAGSWVSASSSSPGRSWSAARPLLGTGTRRPRRSVRRPPRRGAGAGSGRPPGSRPARCPGTCARPAPCVEGGALAAQGSRPGARRVRGAARVSSAVARQDAQVRVVVGTSAGDGRGGSVPVARRAASSGGVIQVVRGAPGGVREEVPRLVDGSHPVRHVLAGMEVRVVALGEPPVRAIHLERARLAGHAEHGVGIVSRTIRHLRRILRRRKARG